MHLTTSLARRSAAALILFGLAATAAASAPPAGARPFCLRLTFGLTDDKATDWSGSAAGEGVRLTECLGIRLLPQNQVLGPHEWSVRTAIARQRQGQRRVRPQTVELRGRAPLGATLSVETKAAAFEVRLGELALFEPLMLLDGRVRATKHPLPTKLSMDDAADDFASIAATAEGQLFGTYASYLDQRDEIRIRWRNEGSWHAITEVPGVSGDVWMPQTACDAQDRLWVVWSQQVEGNWDVYARSLQDNHWNPLQRLTTDAGSDLNLHLTTDARQRLWIVWQAWRDGQSDVYGARLEGDNWSAPAQLTTDAANDWYPALAIDANGQAHVVWDSYRSGDYDVYLRTWDGGSKLGEVEPVAQTWKFEANAAVACAPDGGVWVAYETGGAAWGKDQGYSIRANRRGSTLGSARSIELVCRRDGRGQAPAAPLAGLTPQPGLRSKPSIAVMSDGSLWFRYRQKGAYKPGIGQNARTRHYWVENLVYSKGDSWSNPLELPSSTGRIDHYTRGILDEQDGLRLIWGSDQRAYGSQLHAPVADDVFTCEVARPADAAPMQLAALPETAERRLPEWDAAKEKRDVDAIRAHRTTAGGKECRIVRGDTHRHTELSWDVGPANDGSYLDFYRYMIDCALMDFGNLADHQGGGDYPYWWWLTEKSCDLYHVDPQFIPLYGYERSVTWPNGHRNILHAKRGIPVISFFTKRDLRGLRPGVGTGAVLDDDSKLLFERLRQTGGIAIPHTSGTTMGTDWRDWDEQTDPVVEIYQGARMSYEHVGAPRSLDPEKPRQTAHGGYKPAGDLWNAFAKGQRRGIIASSDHGSTHISYAMVYTPELTRSAIIESIRQRHTYGATDNIILEVRAGEHFMGEEFVGTTAPTLQIKVQGTAEVARVSVISNGQYLTVFEGNGPTLDTEYRDTRPKPGLNYYYVRVEQQDGELAWSSPIWVNQR